MSQAPVTPIMGGGGSKTLCLKNWNVEPLEVCVNEEVTTGLKIPFDPGKYAGRSVGVLVMFSSKRDGSETIDFYAKIVTVSVKADGTVSTVSNDEYSGKMNCFLRLSGSLGTKTVSLTGATNSITSAYYAKNDGVLKVYADNSRVNSGAAWVLSAE